MQHTLRAFIYRDPSDKENRDPTIGEFMTGPLLSETQVVYKMTKHPRHELSSEQTKTGPTALNH